MAWNWEREEWPEFEWNPDLLRSREQAFIEIAVGAVRHLGPDDRAELVIELLSTEALSLSAIEGKSSTVTACNPRCDGSLECRLLLCAAVRRRPVAQR